MAKTSINSITLSPDLSTLYLIDNGRAIAFNLRNKNGILIGMLDGQLSVATAPPVVITETDDPVDDDPDQPDDEPGGVDDDPIKRLAERPKNLKLPAKNAHWSLLFVNNKNVLSVIGALDVDISVIGALDVDISLTRSVTDSSSARGLSVEENKCKMYSFDISKEPINLRRTGKYLIVQY